MPRLARTVSSTGFYHVIIRGGGRRILFENDSDRRYLINLLERYGDKYGIEYHAWCLMDNHVHLLIADTKRNMSKAMHDICCVFAQYYNAVNEHVGSVLQGRYKSFAIETENYLLEVMRYIHNNPIRSGVTTVLDYPWSSFVDYVRGGSLTSTEMFLEMLGGPDGVRDFCNHYDESQMKEIDKIIRGRLTDSEAIELAKQLLGLESPAMIEMQDRNRRNNQALREDVWVNFQRAAS